MHQNLPDLLAGALGAFLPVKNNNIPDLDNAQMVKGYVRLRDKLVQLELMPDDMPALALLLDQPSPPDAFFGTTVQGAVLLLDISTGGGQRGFGGGLVSIDGYRCSTLISDPSLADLETSLSTGVEAVFAGTSLPEWAGLAPLTQQPEWDEQGRVTRMDISLKSVQGSTAKLSNGLTLAIDADWRTAKTAESGFEVILGVRARIHAEWPTTVASLIPLLHCVQDLLSIAFDGHYTASSAGVRFVNQDESFLPMWQATLMPNTEGKFIRLANPRLRPAFTLADIGGAAGVRRWLRLYDDYPRAVAAIVNSIRRPAVSPEVRLLEIAAAIEYWVNSHKGTKWRTKGDGRPEALALHVGRSFATWVGDPSAWGSDVLRHYNGLKHDPKFHPDPPMTWALAESGSLLLQAALLDRAANSRRPSFSLFRNAANHGLGAWFRDLYQ